MTPFGNISVVINPSGQIPLYTCPPGCRVRIFDLVFSNTSTSAISVGLWQSRNGTSTVTMNGRVVPALDSWLAPFKCNLNEGETLYATATVAGWVIASFNYENVDIFDATLPTDTATYDTPGLFVDTTGKTAMATPLVAGQRTMTGLILGQSMVSNNVVGVTTPYVAGATVANMHISGAFYRAEGALLGCGGNSADNPYSRFGDKMVAAGTVDRFNILNRCIGSTDPQHFAKAGHFAGHISLAASNLRSAKLQADFVDLEWGSRAAVFGMSATDFRDGLRAVVAWLRECGIYAPVFVAKHTRFGTLSLANAPAIRSGTDMALSAALGIYDGPDMDTIPDTERSGGGHLLTTGADSSAQLRYNHHAAFFGW